MVEKIQWLLTQRFSSLSFNAGFVCLFRFVEEISGLDTFRNDADDIPTEREQWCCDDEGQCKQHVDAPFRHTVSPCSRGQTAKDEPPSCSITRGRHPSIITPRGEEPLDQCHGIEAVRGVFQAPFFLCEIVTIPSFFEKKVILIGNKSVPIAHVFDKDRTEICLTQLLSAKRWTLWTIRLI